MSELLKMHNSRVNRSLGMSPFDARKRDNWSSVYKKLYTDRWEKKYSSARFRFRKGQNVKIYKLENFAKSFKGRDWSLEVFRINRRFPSRPSTFVIYY